MKKMIDNDVSEILTSSVTEALLSNCDSIYRVDIKNGTYTAVRTSEVTDSLLDKQGDALALLKTLVYHRRKGESPDFYDSFIKRNYQKTRPYLRRIFINASTGRINMIMFFIPTTDRSEAFVILTHAMNYFMPNTIEESSKAEDDEGFLYSMVVDLAKDNCSNIRIKEMANSIQDGMVIAFSEWRENLYSCILPEYRTLFLEKTDVAYITKTLTANKRYSYDLKMYNPDNELKYARHALIRVRDEQQDSLVFLYLVQEIKAEKEAVSLPAEISDPEHQNEQIPATAGRNNNSGDNGFSALSTMILKQVELDIKEHYMEDLSIKQISNKYYINSAYFGQLFIRRFGMTFHKYLTEQRMKAAAALIVNTDDPVSAIAEKVGITSINYFNKTFRMYYGCTPTEYRNSNTRAS